MNVLIACEESQRVCMAFRERGFNAYSCDIQEESGGHPEWHIQGDCLPLLNGNCSFTTRGGQTVTIDDKWDLIIAHPPCTYLSNVAMRNHSLKCTQLTSINARTQKRIEGMLFFMAFVNANCKYIAVENPVGVMNICYRKPDQVIDPYMFAKNVDDVENYVTKRTCLWLKNLPLLAGNDLPRPDNLKLFGVNPSGKISNWVERVTGKDRAKERSKTFEGIARAMAIQWGGYIKGDFIPDRYGQLSF